MFTINQNLIDDFADKINEKEKKNNKVTSWSSTTTDTHYPSEKLVKDSLDNMLENFQTKTVTSTFPIIQTQEFIDKNNDVTHISTMYDGVSGHWEITINLTSLNNGRLTLVDLDHNGGMEIIVDDGTLAIADSNGNIYLDGDTLPDDGEHTATGTSGSDMPVTIPYENVVINFKNNGEDILITFSQTNTTIYSMTLHQNENWKFDVVCVNTLDNPNYTITGVSEYDIPNHYTETNYTFTNPEMDGDNDVFVPIYDFSIVEYTVDFTYDDIDFNNNERSWLLFDDAIYYIRIYVIGNKIYWFNQNPPSSIQSVEEYVEWIELNCPMLCEGTQITFKRYFIDGYVITEWNDSNITVHSDDWYYDMTENNESISDYFNDYDGIDSVNVTVRRFKKILPTLVSDLEDANQYEKVSNKSSSISTDTGSTTKYPTVKAVEDYAQPIGNYLTSHQDISGKLDKAQTSYKGKNVVVDSTSGNITFEDKPTIPSTSSTTPSADTTDGAIGSGTTWAKADHQHPKSSIYAEASHNHTKSEISDFPTLANVATSGSYADLSNKPTLSSLGGTVTVEEQQTAESGFTKTYVIKQNGSQVGSKINIPKDFLVKSATVQTVTTANTPVNGYVSGDKYLDFIINSKDGTATDEHLYVLVSDLVDTEIDWANIQNKPTIPSKTSDLTNDSNFISTSNTAGLIKNDGSIDQSTYLTQHQNISGKEDNSNKVTSWSSTTNDTHYPSEKLVKDSLDDKQATLVSGTNLKTVNNNSLLGSGNINIESGAGGSNITDYYYDTTNNEIVLEYDSGVTQADIVTSWSSTLSDSNVPSEKLVKNSLDAIDGGTVDNALSSSSENPVQNKVIYNALSSKISTSNTVGLIKNDGSIDTSNYLTSHQDISNYVQKSNTSGLLKNDGSVDTSSYITSSSLPSASTTTPSADTTSGSYGSGTDYARSNHTHPKSSLYAESSHTHSAYVNPTIADNLTTNDSSQVLSAKQGKVLNDLIGAAISYINQ